MKYWVKCKVFENHELKNNEFVLVPDGIDAENKEEAIALCIEFIHMREKENRMNSSVSEIGVTSKSDDLERSICQELYLLSDKKTSKISSLEFGNNVHVNFAGRIARKTLAFLASESE